MVMRNISYILLSLTLALSLSGCDMFRKLAKRPTSEEIQAIKERIENEKQRCDTISVADHADSAIVDDGQPTVVVSETEIDKQDSDALHSSDVGVYGPSRLGAIAEGQNLPAYCVVLGAFGSPDNVDRLCNKISSAGYKSLKINTTKALIIVAAEPSDNLSTVFESYKKLSAESFCPKGAWILTNTKK